MKYRKEKELKIALSEQTQRIVAKLNDDSSSWQFLCQKSRINLSWHCSTLDDAMLSLSPPSTKHVPKVVPGWLL